MPTKPVFPEEPVIPEVESLSRPVGSLLTSGALAALAGCAHVTQTPVAITPNGVAEGAALRTRPHLARRLLL